MVAMRDLYERGMTKLTMAGDALEDYKQRFYACHTNKTRAKNAWDRCFPKLDLAEDEFIRRSYRGGWVYLNPLHSGEGLQDVTVFDVNSMFPAQMRYRALPWGPPIWDKPKHEHDLYIVRFDAIFDLKPGYLPTLQDKGSFRYNDAEFLTTSHGDIMQLTLTSVDYKLFHDHYNVKFEQNHKYVTFMSQRGMFNDYIDYWVNEKIRCKKIGDEPGRATAKRFLNSLYGKTGENPEKRSKTASLDDCGVIKWETVQTEGSTWYLPIATFITSYARDMIVRQAQKFGKDFVYADTDSIHCLNGSKYVLSMDLDRTALGAFDRESDWKWGKYIGAKKYIHSNHADPNDGLDEVKMAGVPLAAKENVTWINFHEGTEYDGKLVGRQVPGGYVLHETTYKIKVTIPRQSNEGEIFDD